MSLRWAFDQVHTQYIPLDFNRSSPSALLEFTSLEAGSFRRATVQRHNMPIATVVVRQPFYRAHQNPNTVRSRADLNLFQLVQSGSQSGSHVIVTILDPN